MLSPNLDKATGVGLTVRPVAVTAMDTIKWFKEKWPNGRDKWRAGLKAEKEQQVLAAWYEKKGAAATKPSGT